MINLAPCNHMEADSTIMVHVVDAKMSNSRYWCRCACSSCSATARKSITLDCIWYWQELPLHPCSWDMCITWSTEISSTSHVSCFHRLRHCILVCPSGKKTAWKLWATHDEFTANFYELHNSPQQIAEETEASFGYFTILLYDMTATCISINEVWKLPFTHKGRQMSALPPTKAALQQHSRRAVLQGGHIWASTTVPYRQMPSPAVWGWTCPEQWKPLWTHLPEARVSCPELRKCARRSRCRNCKCVKAQLKCTVYCTCKEDCDNT